MAVFYLNCTETSRFDIMESVHGGTEVTLVSFCFSTELYSPLTL